MLVKYFGWGCRAYQNENSGFNFDSLKALLNSAKVVFFTYYTAFFLYEFTLENLVAWRITIRTGLRSLAKRLYKICSGYSHIYFITSTSIQSNK